MAELGAMIVRIGADISDFERKMSKTEKVFSDLGKKTEEMGKRIATRVTLPLLAAGTAAVTFATKMDNLKRGLNAVTGSSAETEKQLKRLREVAKLPGLGFEEAIQGSVRLQAAGFAATLAEDALRGFGNALATVGAGKAELDQVTRALSQIASKGKISAEEINQIAEVVPQIRVVMQQAFGTSNSELLQKAGIDAQTFVRKVTDELLKLEQVTGGPANAFENLGDSVKLAAANLGNALLPPVIEIANGLAAMAEKFQTVDAATMRTVVAWGVAAAAIGPFFVLVGKLTAAVTALSTALRIGLLPLLGVGGVLIVGLTALSAWFVKNKLDAMAAAGAADEYKTSLSGLSEGLAKMKLADVSATISLLEAERATLPATVTERISAGVGGPGVAVSKTNPRITELNTEIAGLYEQWRLLVSGIGKLQNEKLTPSTSGGLPVRLTDDEKKKLIDDRIRRGLGGRDAKDLSFGNGDSLRLPQRGFWDHAKGIRKDQELIGRTGRLVDLDLKPTHRLQAMGDARIPMGPQRQGLLGGVGGGLKDIGGQISSQIGGIIAQFGPLAAVAAALRPVFQGMMDTLGPVLETLAKPLRVVGNLIGMVLVPVLELLAPPLNLLAKGVSYVVEAFGWLIEALGKFVDKLIPDWLSKAGKGLAKMGQELQDGARNARRGLDGAADAADRVAGAMNNIPKVLPLALIKHNIANGGVTGGVVGGGTVPGGTTRPGSRPAITINVFGSSDPRATAEEVGRVIGRQTSRGGAPWLGLAV